MKRSHSFIVLTGRAQRLALCTIGDKNTRRSEEITFESFVGAKHLPLHGVNLPPKFEQGGLPSQNKNVKEKPPPQSGSVKETIILFRKTEGRVI